MDRGGCWVRGWTRCDNTSHNYYRSTGAGVTPPMGIWQSLWFSKCQSAGIFIPSGTNLSAIIIPGRHYARSPVHVFSSLLCSRVASRWLRYTPYSACKLFYYAWNQFSSMVYSSLDTSRAFCCWLRCYRS